MSTYDNNGKLVESFYSALAGVTFENRQSLLKNLYVGQRLVLQRQPSNPYDSNAIAVYDSNSMRQVGFIRKYVAANLAPILDRSDRKVCCTIKNITGGGDNYLGINILIEIYDLSHDTNSELNNDDNKFKVKTMYFSINNEGTMQITPNPRNSGPIDNFCFNSLEDVMNSDFYPQNTNTTIYSNNETCCTGKSFPKFHSKDVEQDFYEYDGGEEDSGIPEQELRFLGTGAPFL